MDLKDTKRLNDILRMLKCQESITPSYEQFVKALKENPRIIWMFDLDDPFFKKGAIYELANAIRMYRGYW